MKVLVTGGTGFLGRHVCRALERRGHEVAAASRGGESPCPGVRGLGADLLADGVPERLIEEVKPAGLVHLAWETSPGFYWDSPLNLRWVALSLMLADAFQRSGGGRMVVAGTSAEYQWGGESDLAEDATPLAPRGLYGTAKNSLRDILMRWSETSGVSVAWGRLFCPIGRGEHPARLLPRMMHRLATEKEIEFDSGSQERDFMAAEDLGEAFGALFDAKVRGAVNLASGEGVSIRELLETLTRYLGESSSIRWGVRPEPANEPARVVASVRRLREEVGWVPPVGFQERIRQLCADWKKENSL